MIDKTLDILKSLISFRSITPNDDGALSFCSEYLKTLGFVCEIFDFCGVKNLYAKLGDSSKNICFAGHVDVVPPLNGWTVDPFEMTIRNGNVYGRGANDMKGPLSSCFSAIYSVVTNNLLSQETSLSVLLTSDEEIMGEHGTKEVVKLLQNRGEKIAGCILCESCSPGNSGEYVKIGCRGSLSIDIKSKGKQCHVANAPIFGNHLHEFLHTLDIICSLELDKGSNTFSPSSIQLTSLNTIENSARNIVSPEIVALLNVRFNDHWTFNSLESYITDLTKEYPVQFTRFGMPFIGASEQFSNKISDIIKEAIGIVPRIGTDGGNSDALFIKDICDVVEVGSPICNAHIIDEFIAKQDLEKLQEIYKNVMLKL